MKNTVCSSVGPLPSRTDEQARFVVYFDGQLRRGYSRAEVEQRLRRQLRLSAEKIERFFTGRVKLRSGLDRQRALRLQKQFYDVGALLQIEVEPPSADGVLGVEQIRAAFATPAPAETALPAYRTRLLLVALLTLLIPLLYIAAIAAVAAALAVGLASVDRIGAGDALRAAALGATSTLGATLLLAMLKPLLTRRPRRPRQMLSPVRHRPLFELTEGLCRYLGVPPPAALAVDGEARVSAVPQRGPLGLPTGRIELTVGLPLLAGLNSRQLVAVLARQCGHCSPRGGTLAYCLINAVNGWLYDRAFRPDAWDLRLAVAARQGFAPQRWACRALLCALIPVRGLLRVLVRLGDGCGRSLSRKLASNADRIAARVVGSAAFADAGFALHALANAAREVERFNDRRWREGGALIDDLPGAIAAAAAGYDERALIALDQGVGDGRTYPWNLRPADGVGVANAARDNAPGVFFYLQPARTLLADFGKLCRTLTLRQYRDAGISEPEAAAVSVGRDETPPSSRPSPRFDAALAVHHLR